MTISPDRILYSDAHLLAVNKLSGELVVKGKGKVEKLPLFDFLKKDYPGLRVLHRLDFETSGVVLFARTQEAYDAVISSDFKDWKKIYRTLVMGVIDKRNGIINFPLPARRRGKISGPKDVGNVVDAMTRYAVLERFVNSTYLEAEIETGRHHQIRRHFEKIKHPLVLDHIYGHKKFNNVFTSEFRYRKFFLHAARLEVKHPITGEKIVVEAPIPKVFEQVLKKLK